MTFLRHLFMAAVLIQAGLTHRMFFDDEAGFEPEAEAETMRVESRSRAPFWLKPKQMERKVFAEPLNAQVWFFNQVVSNLGNGNHSRSVN